MVNNEFFFEEFPDERIRKMSDHAQAMQSHYIIYRENEKESDWVADVSVKFDDEATIPMMTAAPKMYDACCQLEADYGVAMDIILAVVYGDLPSESALAVKGFELLKKSVVRCREAARTAEVGHVAV